VGLGLGLRVEKDINDGCPKGDVALALAWALAVFIIVPDTFMSMTASESSFLICSAITFSSMASSKSVTSGVTLKLLELDLGLDEVEDEIFRLLQSID